MIILHFIKETYNDFFEARGRIVKWVKDSLVLHVPEEWSVR